MAIVKATKLAMEKAEILFDEVLTYLLCLGKLYYG